MNFTLISKDGMPIDVPKSGFSAVLAIEFNALPGSLYVDYVLLGHPGQLLQDLCYDAPNAGKYSLTSRLRQTILRSDTAVIQVLYSEVTPFSLDLEERLRKKKYEYIYSLKAWLPLGLNDLDWQARYKYAPTEERNLARGLIQRLLREEKIQVSSSVGGVPGREVYRYNKATGRLIDRFSSVAEAARAIKLSASSIYHAASGAGHSAGGYLWSFKWQAHYHKGVSAPISTMVNNGRAKHVWQYDKTTGKLLNEFPSATAACQSAGICLSALSKGIASATGLASGSLWSYEKYDVHPGAALIKNRGNALAEARRKHKAEKEKVNKEKAKTWLWKRQKALAREALKEQKQEAKTTSLGPKSPEAPEVIKNNDSIDIYGGLG